MGDDYLNYNGQLTDDPPVVVARYSVHWRSFLLAVADILSNPAMWNPADDVQLAVSQAHDLLTILIGEDDVPPASYPENIFLPVMACDWISAGGYTYQGATVQAFNHWYYPTVPVNGEDVLRLSVALSAGNYLITTVGRIDIANGKFRWVLNGVEFAPGLDIDMYANPAVNNYVFPRAFTVASDGLYTFVLRNVGKNPLSTNYYFILTGIWIRKIP